jgi:hypothetical protein
METTYPFFTDPGHGWLRVPRKRLETLRIAHKITSYSYQNNAFVYLEEDCDAPLFLHAAEAAGWKVTVRERTPSLRPSIIRQFDKYRPAAKKTTFTPHPSYEGQGYVKVPDEYIYPYVFLGAIGLEKYQVYDYKFCDPRSYRVDLDNLLKAAGENGWEIEILPEYTPE